jgi:hypothetical protein
LQVSIVHFARVAQRKWGMIHKRFPKILGMMLSFITYNVTNELKTQQHEIFEERDIWHTYCKSKSAKKFSIFLIY